jgi:mRNA interferase MazF
MKLRPVLPLTGATASVPEVLVAYISSVIPVSYLRSDIVLDPSAAEHATTNLKTTSVLRLPKLATIHGRSIVRRIGFVSPTTAREIHVKLRNLLDLRVEKSIRMILLSRGDPKQQRRDNGSGCDNDEHKDPSSLRFR